MQQSLFSQAVFVDPAHGSHAWPGTEQQPLASLQDAITLAGTLSSQDTVTILPARYPLITSTPCPARQAQTWMRGSYIETHNIFRKYG